MSISSNLSKVDWLLDFSFVCDGECLTAEVQTISASLHSLLLCKLCIELSWNCDIFCFFDKWTHPMPCSPCSLAQTLVTLLVERRKQNRMRPSVTVILIVLTVYRNCGVQAEKLVIIILDKCITLVSKHQQNVITWKGPNKIFQSSARLTLVWFC